MVKRLSVLENIVREDIQNLKDVHFPNARKRLGERFYEAKDYLKNGLEDAAVMAAYVSKGAYAALKGYAGFGSWLGRHAYKYNETSSYRVSAAIGVVEGLCFGEAAVALGASPIFFPVIVAAGASARYMQARYAGTYAKLAEQENAGRSAS